MACSEARLLCPYLKANGNITAEDWKASGSGTQRMEAVRTILEGQSPEEGQASHVHLLRARGCAVGTDEHDAGATTLRSLDRVLLGMLRSLSGELRVKRGEEPDRNKEKKSFVPGHCCR